MIFVYFINFINVLFQITLVGDGVTFLLRGCRNLVDRTLIGGDLVIFLLMREVRSQTTHYGKDCGPLSKSACLNFFALNFSRKTLSFEFIFVWEFSIMIGTYKTSSGSRWFLEFFGRVFLLKSSSCTKQNNSVNTPT